jgi:DNA-binding NarL/FixJ family response regulator
VVGEAVDGLSALDLVQELEPEIAILDLQMPDLGGLEVARRLQSAAPATKVIILSMHGDEPFVQEAMRYGVLGYVLKGAATSDLTAAVHSAMAGKRFLSPTLNERAINAYASRAQGRTGPLDRYELLTNREREVVQLAAQGLSNAEIGERLSISPRTAETHRTNLMRKLGLKDQTELMRFAIRRGLVIDPGS